MVITSWNYGVNAQGWKFAPCTRYVISESMFRNIGGSLEEQGFKNAVGSWSCFNSYERRYGGQDLNGRRLAIYRENGFGDNLMISGLTGYLKTTYPQATIDVFALPRVAAAWVGNTDVSFLDVPPVFDAIANRYDYHLFIEGFIENDTEPDQKNAYDSMLSFCGIYPKSVPDNFKRPQIFWTDEDEKMDGEWQAIMPKQPYIFWHWNPSGRVRQYPFDQSREAIALLAEHFEVVVGGDLEGGIPNLDMDNPRVHNWIGKTPSVRSFLPMLRRSKAVVCPDSCVLHMAGAIKDVPTVALYGAFAHRDRSLYYRNVTPIEPFAACPSAPCRSQRSELPVHRCQQSASYKEGMDSCAATASITPGQIVETVLKVTR